MTQYDINNDNTVPVVIINGISKIPHLTINIQIYKFTCRTYFGKNIVKLSSMINNCKFHSNAFYYKKDNKWLFSSLACLHQNHGVEHFRKIKIKNESMILDMFDPRM